MGLERGICKISEFIESRGSCSGVTREDPRLRKPKPSENRQKIWIFLSLAFFQCLHTVEQLELNLSLLFLYSWGALSSIQRTDYACFKQFGPGSSHDGSKTQAGETPVGNGALDETFDLADLVEGVSAEGREVAAIFLDCSKCYERVPFASVKTILLEAGLPPALVGPAVAMYRGDWRLLVDGAVSDPVRPHNGIPARCGLAVDFLHAYLARALGKSGAHLVQYRKCADDMILVAVGRRVGPDLRETFLQAREAFARAGMVLNPKKTVVVTNGPVARASVTAAWRNPPSLFLPLGIWGWMFSGDRGGTRSSRAGWAPFRLPWWSCALWIWWSPKKLSSLRPFTPWPFKGRRWVAWRTATSKICVLRPGLPLAEASLRRVAELELVVHGGLVADPQVAVDQLRAWRGSRAGSFASSLSLFLPLVLIGSLVAEGGGPPWETLRTPLGDLPCPEAVANTRHASFNSVLTGLVVRCSDFRSLEHGIDPIDFRSWRRWASGATHSKRAAVNVALRGAWADQRCNEAFGGSACCSLCGGPAGTTHHQTYECPAGMVVRDAVGLKRVDGPPCLLEHGLVPAPPRQERSKHIPWKAPMESQFGRMVRDGSLLTRPSGPVASAWSRTRRGEGGPLGVNQSVYRAELLAVTLALERLRGSGCIVSDCKGVVKVVLPCGQGCDRPGEST